MARKQSKQPTLNVVARTSPQPTNAQPAPAGNAYISAERDRMISEAAYLRAERRGFAPGNEMEDWLQAESEIDSLIPSGGSRSAESVEAA
jgi:hypothetical protein